MVEVELIKFKEKHFAWFSIFMFIFLTSSFAVTNDIISSAATILLWVILMVVLLWRNQSLDYHLIILIAVIVIIMTVSSVINGENLRNLIFTIFALVCAILFISCFDWDSFTKHYVDVMCVLSIVSLICFVVYMLIPSIRYIALVQNNAGNTYSCLFFYVGGGNFNRNYGLFWEPGAYQTFINLALLFEVCKDKPKISTILILIVTVITTYSTTGYLALGLILILLYIRKGANSKLKLTITPILFIGFIFAYLNQDLLFGSSLSSGESTVFGKLIRFFSDSGVSPTLGSEGVRFNAIFEVIRAFLEKPILGYGYQGLITRTYEFTLGMNTCTMVNWFAVYGVAYGGIMLSGVVRTSKKIGNSFWNRFIVFIILFVITMSENYVNNAVITMLCLYGYYGKPAIMDSSDNSFSKVEKYENTINQ